MRSSDRALRALALASAGAIAFGCVTRQRDEMVAAREAYHDCVREHPETHETRCAELEAESVTRQERYEEEGRRAWGCHGSDRPGCDPRDRSSRSP